MLRVTDMPTTVSSADQFRNHAGFTRNDVQGARGPGPRQRHRGQGSHEGKQGLPRGGDVQIHSMPFLLFC